VFIAKEKETMAIVSFKAANEESKAVLDLAGIPYQESEEGVDVQFPESVEISSDQDEYSQPSYYIYQVGQERFVYPLDTETLAVE
jgi:hypothetical protein